MILHIYQLKFCIIVADVIFCRYNISTDDYDPVSTDSKFNNNKYVFCVNLILSLRETAIKPKTDCLPYGVILF